MRERDMLPSGLRRQAVRKRRLRRDLRGVRDGVVVSHGAMSIGRVLRQHEVRPRRKLQQLSGDCACVNGQKHGGGLVLLASVLGQGVRRRRLWNASAAGCASATCAAPISNARSSAPCAATRRASRERTARTARPIVDAAPFVCFNGGCCAKQCGGKQCGG